MKKESFDKALVRTRLSFNFLKTFSLKNKGFKVLNNEKNNFSWFFKDFFVEEQDFRVLNNEK